MEELSTPTLSPKSSMLLNLLAFFDADVIPERLLSDSQTQLKEYSSPSLYRASGYFEGAVTELTAASLIDRLPASEALSIDRTVQSRVLAALSEQMRAQCFYIVVNQVSCSLPKDKGSPGELGHGYRNWEKCAAVLPHVRRLISLFQDKNARDSAGFSHLVFRMGNYLYETERPAEAKSLIDFGVSNLDEDDATAYRILGHIALDTAKPRAAMTAYRRSLKITHDMEDNDTLLADAYDSIACCYTEMDDAERAMTYISRSIAKRGFESSARTRAISALMHLRANRPSDSLTVLNACWELQGLTQDDVENSKYPKHSGDIVLLARIKHALGETETARDLLSRSIEMRRAVYGDKSPRVADSMFLLSRMVDDRQATVLLEDIVDISKGMPEMKGQSARAMWFLANIEEKNRNAEEANSWRNMAREERDKIDGRETAEGENQDTDDGFMGLVAWMLW